MHNLSHLTDEQMNQLATTIRNHDCVEALRVARKIVGPTPQEAQASEMRLRMIDWLWDQAKQNCWGNIPEQWPGTHADQYKNLIAKQTEFENEYL